jgi:hypothetical protein
MVRPVKNNMKQSTRSQRSNNLKKKFMMIRLWVILFMIKIKFYMNKKLMKNKNFQKIIWHH